MWTRGGRGGGRNFGFLMTVAAFTTDEVSTRTERNKKVGTKQYARIY